MMRVVGGLIREAYLDAVRGFGQLPLSSPKTHLDESLHEVECRLLTIDSGWREVAQRIPSALLSAPSYVAYCGRPLGR